MTLEMWRMKLLHQSMIQRMIPGKYIIGGDKVIDSRVTRLMKLCLG